MKRTPILLFVSGLVLLLLLPAAALAAKPTFNQAVDQLVTSGYSAQVESTINNFGTSPMGFRYAGSTSDTQAAKYIADQWRKAGLVNVRLEPVPVDAYNFYGADVTVGNRVMPASSFGGIPATTADGISSDVVYVGYGTASDFDKVDVDGKIALIDMKMSLWWLNIPCAEATARGAIGVILTFTPGDPSYYATPDALGTFDGYYDLKWVPAVYISWRDGDWLKGQIAAASPAPVSGTMVNNTYMQLATDGGTGYNVYGELPGKVRNGEMVVINSHHDAYFRAGLDDTSAVTAETTIAKAMKMSGYKPDRTIVFFSTTAEEYGLTNAYYEWCIGAWWAATHSHSDWAGKVVGLVNLESQGARDCAFSFRVPADFRPWVKSLADANPGLLSNGYAISGPSSWTDMWTFMAAGIPAFTDSTSDLTGYYSSHFYHTQYDTDLMIDWPYFARLAKFNYLMLTAFADTSKLLPYSPVARANDLIAKIGDGTRLKNAGAEVWAVDELVDANADLKTAAVAYEGMTVPASELAAVNAKLVAIQKTIYTNLSGLTVYEGPTYPFEQVLWDTEALQATIAHLGAPDKAAALADLVNVGLTVQGIELSPQVYAYELTRHDPNYYRVTWGGQGRLPAFLNVVPQYRMIEAGQFDAAIDALSPALQDEQGDLTARSAAMAAAIRSVTRQIEAL
jgi:hypothetical protein